MKLNWDIERELMAEGYSVICGVDEAGRGPLAGPVVAAAVILPFGASVTGLDDSKKLSEKKREALYSELTQLAVGYAVGQAEHSEVDERGILNATYLAMNRALNQLCATLGKEPAIAIIDGNQNAGIKYPSRCIVKGDAKSPSIAAASIIAKVTRDRHMLDIAGKYPQYAFERHKGYGTKLHYELLAQHGRCEIHRESFLKNLANKS